MSSFLHEFLTATGDNPVAVFIFNPPCDSGKRAALSRDEKDRIESFQILASEKEAVVSKVAANTSKMLQQSGKHPGKDRADQFLQNRKQP